MRTRSYLALAILMAAGLGMAVRGVHAQDDPTMPPDTAAIFDSIDDIDKLRLLNPLNLTAAQLDKIIPFLKQRQQAYNRRILELAIEPLKALATDIKATRTKLLAGGTVPQDIDEKIKRCQKDFSEKRKIEQDKNLKLVADGIRAVLTTEQYKAIVTMARRDFPEGKGTDEQFYNLWIRETILAYPRIIPLLEDMRNARAGQQPKNQAP